MSDAVNKPAHYNQGPIECIDAMQQILTPEEFRGFLKGNAFKYLWREKGKNGIEDLRKAKWYLNRLIDSFDASETEQLATGEVTGEVKPPDGWRFLEVGEVICRGDLGFENGLWYSIEPIMIGMTLQAHWKPMIRRNKFEVGEKVVYIGDKNNFVFVVKGARADGHFFVERNWHEYVIAPKFLAPYIEETK